MTTATASTTAAVPPGPPVSLGPSGGPEGVALDAVSYNMFLGACNRAGDVDRSARAPFPQIPATPNKLQRAVFRRFRPPGAVSRPRDRQDPTQDEKSIQGEKRALGNLSRGPGAAS